MSLPNTPTGNWPSTVFGWNTTWRDKMPEHTVAWAFQFIENQVLRQRYLLFLNDNPFFNECPAGKRHHHYWKGGLVLHTLEIMGILFDLLSLYDNDLSSVTREDLVICAFIHDFSKVWRYQPLTAEQRSSGKFPPEQEYEYTDNSAFYMVDEHTKTILELGKWGIQLTEAQASALLFHEGGWSDANFGFGGPNPMSSAVFHANPLATLMHIADMFSSQLLSRDLNLVTK